MGKIYRGVTHAKGDAPAAVTLDIRRSSVLKSTSAAKAEPEYRLRQRARRRARFLLCVKREFFIFFIT